MREQCQNLFSLYKIIKMIARGLPNRKKFAFVRGDKMEYQSDWSKRTQNIAHKDFISES